MYAGGDAKQAIKFAWPNKYLRIPDPQRRGGPCQFSISVTNNIRVFI